MKMVTALLAAAVLTGGEASAQDSRSLPYSACFQSAATLFNVDKRLLVAIAQTESSLRGHAVGPKNSNGSYDMGIMQINSAWIPTLAKKGISTQQIMDPCTNIHIGAWILSGNINRHGPVWKAVGAYNASTASKQVSYVEKVQRNYQLVAPLMGAAYQTQGRS